MLPPKLLAAFQSQLSRYGQIAKAEGLDSGSRGLPSDALSFAESLLLCPTEDAAIKQMRQGPKEARTFLQVAMIVDDVRPNIEIAIAEPNLTTTTPFFVLACGVQEYLQWLKSQVPDIGSEIRFVRHRIHLPIFTRSGTNAS
jgi:hypothetical protein